MKHSMIAIAVTMILVDTGHSQNVNWRSLRDDQRNVVQFSAGYDYGATAQFGYSRTLNIFTPALVGVEYSMPMGSDLFDDFKVLLEGRIEIVEIAGFSATMKIASVFRRYQTDLVRIESFGSDFGILVGYCRPTWAVAGEWGFDKAITTHVTHSQTMKAVYPAIRDGWYVPTGGHHYYGVHASKTIGESVDLALRLGFTNAQENDADAVLPLYLQVGLGVRF